LESGHFGHETERDERGAHVAQRGRGQCPARYEEAVEILRALRAEGTATGSTDAVGVRIL
jgi:hypothetical protein